MNDKPLYQEIFDEDYLSYLQGKVANVIEKPHLISHLWVQQNNWVVLPVEYSINPMDAEWICEAAEQLGYEEGVAITTEENVKPRAFRIKWTQNSLLAIDKDLGLVNFLIAPEDLKFAVLRESGEYFLIAGPRDFVRKASGASFKTVRRMFKDYAVDETLPKKLRDFLLEIYNQYLPYNGDV